MWLFISGILGFLGVALGAYADHALKTKVDDNIYQSFTTALKYHQYTSIILLAIGLAFIAPSLENSNLRNNLHMSAGVFLLGTLLFSGSIYLSTIFDVKLKFLAPWGGVLLMVAWGILAYAGIKLMVK
jgi:uncharacterized membrane protein YgdD (TMEM256/DUF423 family)